MWVFITVCNVCRHSHRPEYAEVEERGLVSCNDVEHSTRKLEIGNAMFLRMFLRNIYIYVYAVKNTLTFAHRDTVSHTLFHIHCY